MSNVLEEQMLISRIYNIINSNSNYDASEEIDNIINKIELEYFNSYVLYYYIGLYYDKKNILHLAQDYYNKSIKIKPLFTAPYFQLTTILMNQNNFYETEKLLKYIFNKKTLDPFSKTGNIQYNFMDNLRIVSILLPEYIKNKDYKNAEHLIKQILPKFQNIHKDKLQYRHLELWKNIHISYATIFVEKYFNMEKANEIYYLGLEGLCNYNYTQSLDIYDNLHKLDKTLFQGFILSSHYINSNNIKKLSFTINDLYDRYRIKDDNNIDIRENLMENNKLIRKIRIGYISPDFNKNAVGLFVTSLLKFYNKDNFELFIYYKNKNIDEFTEIFQSYIKFGNWFNIEEIDENILYNIIKYDHKLDILIDLISSGVGSSLEVLAKKPAPIIINYLGFPDICGLKEVDYRIVDNITDPNPIENNIHETLIKTPKCFICYTLFDNIPLPNINYKNKDNKFVYIGIMNKLSKHSDIIRKTWLSILLKKKTYILCLKLGENNDINIAQELYKDFPKSQIKFLPFTKSLPEYFEQFNEIDFCVDTYPYSGTTTTCSSLLMGVPIFTIYHDKNSHHVSNVTTSLNIYSEQDKTTICKNFNEYKSKIINYKINRNNENEERIKRRESFLKCMEPNEFMKNYENMLYNILSIS